MLSVTKGHQRLLLNTHVQETEHTISHTFDLRLQIMYMLNIGNFGTIIIGGRKPVLCSSFEKLSTLLGIIMKFLVAMEQVFLYRVLSRNTEVPNML